MKHIAFIILAALLCACGQESVITVTLPDGFEVSARVADTPQTHEKGLMFVKYLPENEGMLFVFEEEDELVFWMKNTLIDLDMIFIDGNQTVTSVAAEMPHSYTYTPDDQVAYAGGWGKYVLELPAKTAAKHGVQEGALIRFSLAEEK